ncbi:cytochrome c-type biogenesis protein [Methylomarinum vadi]|uniref:cytochrome c-type biogenesis protein n=1 Tax=Methylomarinum vadi TaxID=438855 RepID=UPI0004DEEAEF|nr:cytochrome c-type biogenesis protein [Methylomarinum vadi]
MRWLYFFVLALFLAHSQAGVEYREFDNADQEETYQGLISELRCLVCQNQTIADSNADLAKDLRRQVYEMLRQGKSRQEIVEFMTQRYGDFVMYRPPFKTKTMLLWLGPLLFVLIGLVALVVVSRRRRAAAAALPPEKKAKIHALLEEGDES